ncbi:MAG: carboxypeptidase-like regulatory domain-containing protein [Ferruginibacter sp.]
MKKIQLSIPDPCHQSWDHMTPTQQGRFCNACAKEVIDFSQMSDTDVLNYFSIVNKDKVCGRAYPDQLNRNIETMPAKKISWYWHYAIAFFLFFSKSTTAKAQGLVIINTQCSKRTKPLNINNRLQQLRLLASPTITGTIQTEDGRSIPFASIKRLHSNDGIGADEDGKFLLKIDSLPCIIEISSLGYETKQVSINDLSEKKIVLQQTSELMDGVVVTSPRNYSLGVLVGGLSITSTVVKRNFIKDTVERFFNPAIKIYPNPIMQGHAFTVALSLKQTGSYTIQIINAAGIVLLERKINVLVKKHNEQLVSSSSWSCGIHYLRVTDDKGKNIGACNIVMQ